MSPKTVLIVEDEPMIALSIEQHLDDLGYRATATSSIEQALERIEQGDIDLCILDYDIRGRASTPVAAALHERSVPFVLCSGSDVPTLADLFEGVLILGKPFTQVDLESAVTSALQGEAR